MITDALLSVVSAVVLTALGVLPSFDVPSFLAPGGALEVGAQMVGGYIAPLGGWMPFGAISAVAGPLIYVMGLTVAVRLIRIAISTFTGGGGSV